VPGRHFADATRFALRRREPRHGARAAETLRYRQPRLGAHLRAQFAAQRDERTLRVDSRRAGQRLLDTQRHAGEVGIEVVERADLHDRREPPHHLGDALAVAFRQTGIAGAHDQLGAPPQRLVQRHRGVHAAGFGLVRTRRHDPGPDGDRAAAQRRVAQLFDRGEEGVDVEVQDAALHRCDTNEYLTLARGHQEYCLAPGLPGSPHGFPQTQQFSRRSPQPNSVCHRDLGAFHRRIHSDAAAARGVAVAALLPPHRQPQCAARGTHRPEPEPDAEPFVR